MQAFRSMAVVTLVALTGCASIFAGTTQDIAIKSDPSQAMVIVVDEAESQVFAGTTPADVTLEKKHSYFAGKSYRVTIEKSGYKPVQVSLEPGAGGWYLFGNLLVGGLIGWVIVDPLTGAMWTLRPKEIDQTLEGQVSQLDEGTLSIVLLQDVPARLQGSMVPVN